ncbi:MAG: hypothetical protein Q9226_007247, partial [Calogaya cf. arnoldii]
MKNQAKKASDNFATTFVTAAVSGKEPSTPRSPAVGPTLKQQKATLEVANDNDIAAGYDSSGGTCTDVPAVAATRHVHLNPKTFAVAANWKFRTGIDQGSSQSR